MSQVAVARPRIIEAPSHILDFPCQHRPDREESIGSRAIMDPCESRDDDVVDDRLTERMESEQRGQ